MSDKKKQSVVFAYWVNGELKGFRSDSFGTLSMKSPKIYGYSKEQVETIIKNTKYELNHGGTAFMKYLAGSNTKFITADGSEEVTKETVVGVVYSAEQEKRDWEEFELRVHPFIDREDADEQWKRDVAINNLEPAIEVHKFKVIEQEN